MDSFAKAIDGIVKAPLWLYFAVAVVAWAPLMNFSPLAHVGITGDAIFIGLPMAFWALCASAIFISSLAARLFPAIGSAVGRWLSGAVLKFRLKNLSKKAIALLTVVEEDAWGKFAYDPEAAEIQELRDKNILRAVTIKRIGPPGDSRTNGGEFELTDEFRSIIYSNIIIFRKFKYSSLDEVLYIHKKMNSAHGYLIWYSHNYET